ncbi:hypothetical protein RI103_34990 [Paraburkholderia sp. FT54]|uniref:hypothetical protein n=1 Tax=Paraburkholderia sp. FT54 TaxID=3074437 RepID=UPI0028774301|nr:hypothetical protein [Paraburkholderia sp. FT54]WNC94381.1 hypothetical protein RI103_34990 [Paraburkholderia sp. FT54]
MTDDDRDMPPDSVASVRKLTITPGTGGDLRSFARVEVEFVEGQPGSDGSTSSVAVSLTFNVDRLTLDQVKDFAILHAKRLMNHCVTDPHLKIGDRRLED